MLLLRLLHKSVAALRASDLYLALAPWDSDHLLTFAADKYLVFLAGFLLFLRALEYISHARGVLHKPSVLSRALVIVLGMIRTYP